MFQNPLQMVLIGLGMMCIGFVLFRGSRRQQKSQGRDLLKETERDFVRTEQTIESRIQKMEVRLLDYQREVDAQVAMKMETLQQLILTAKEQIARLESLTGSGEISPKSQSEAVSHSRQFMMSEQLQLAGFSVQEIAKMLDTSPEEIESCLNLADREEAQVKKGHVA